MIAGCQKLPFLLRTLLASLAENPFIVASVFDKLRLGRFTVGK